MIAIPAKMLFMKALSI